MRIILGTSAMVLGLAINGKACGQSIKLASVSTSGEQANNYAAGRALSADGRFVLIASQATNLVVPDTNGTAWDLFLHDVHDGTTIVVSVNSDGEQGNFSTQHGLISSNGRYVLFATSSTNMPPPAGNWHNVFLHDRLTGLTEGVNLTYQGGGPNGPSGAGYVTPDGRFATFGTAAQNVVQQPYSGPQGFLRDRLLGETSIVTINSQGEPVASVTGLPGPDAGYMSDDGRFVAFGNIYNDLMPGGEEYWRKIYVRDRELGITSLVSVPHDGAPLDGDCGQVPHMSSDGRFVMFSSQASNLVPNDTNGVQDIFVRDVLGQTTYRVSVSSTGEQANALCFPRAMSRNGRFYAFDSTSTTLDPNDASPVQDGFIHDLWKGTTEKVTWNWQGGEINNLAVVSGVSNDGRIISMGTAGTNVIKRPVNGFWATYVRARWKLGDVNRDGVVNVVDLLAVINAWGPCPAPPPPPALPIPCDADVTNDNTVNVADLLLIINNWG